MSILDKAKNYAKGLKEQEAKNKELGSLPMEERIKQRPEGVLLCLVNSLGKILDVYENKVVFTTTRSTSTLVTGILFSGSQMTQGEKTIFYKDAIGVQFKLSSLTDGYIQIETPAGNMTSTSSSYGGENSIQFGKEKNEEAATIAAYIKSKIEEIKNAPAGAVVNQNSSADELIKFKGLLDAGVITPEEFAEKKRQLLGL